MRRRRRATAGQHNGVQTAQDVSGIGDGLRAVRGNGAYQFSARQGCRKWAVLGPAVREGFQCLGFILGDNKFDLSAHRDRWQLIGRTVRARVLRGDRGSHTKRASRPAGGNSRRSQAGSARFAAAPHAGVRAEYE
jgi:hypothetical protein